MTLTAAQVTSLTTLLTGQPLGRLATMDKTVARLERAFTTAFGDERGPRLWAGADLLIAPDFDTAKDRVMAFKATTAADTAPDAAPDANDGAEATDHAEAGEADPAATEATIAKPKRAREPAEPKEPRDTKKARLIAMLKQPGGTTLDDVCRQFGWLQHTARSAITAGVGTKLGNVIHSEKIDGVRRYSIIAQETEAA